MKNKDNESAYLILDSKHNNATLKSMYDIKLVDLNDFIQVYIYHDKKVRTNNRDNDLDLKKNKIEDFVKSDSDSKNKTKIELTNEIEERSIIRSKLQCQRLAKANIDEWETFITLTFEDNITSVEFANKRFKYFVDKVRRVKKDFKYICITEFQKRGAVHYHLLCNININDDKLLYVQEDNPKYKHIKYWLEGFTSVEVIKGDPKKIIGYISKYMTKDIDNRLFGHNRYFYSRNINRPIENFIDTENKKERDFYIKKIQDKDLVYRNEYINPYDNRPVTFLEFRN